MVIFALLFGLAKFAAGGLRHGRQQGSNWLHMLVTAVSIYVILDIEYPRLGLIRVDAFDQLFAREHEVNFGVEPLALTTG